MSRYCNSKGRIMLLAVLLVTAGWIVSDCLAQASGGVAAAQPAPSARGISSLIMENRDVVFYAILVCSVTALTLILQSFTKVRRSSLLPQATTERIRQMISARQFRELLQFTQNDPTFLSRSIHPALRRAPDFQSMREALETAVAEQTSEQFRRIEYLNIIGNLGPLLGLLGTVLGMIYSFNELNAAGGEAKPAALALGISKALTHTMLGLMLAIPCLAAFGVLRTWVDRLTTQGALLAEELLLSVDPADLTGPISLRPPMPAAPPVRRSESIEVTDRP